MSEREEWMNLIRNEYDPKPNLARGDYPAFGWDDGAGRIADAILADKLLTVKAERERAAKLIPEFESIFGKITATERRWLSHRIAGLEV